MKTSTRKQLSRLVDLGFSDPDIFALALKCSGMCSHLKSFVDRYDTDSPYISFCGTRKRVRRK